MARNNDTLMEIVEHAEQQLQAGTFDVLGWWKASSTNEDITVNNPKCHIMNICRRSGPALRKFETAQPLIPVIIAPPISILDRRTAPSGYL